MICVGYLGHPPSSRAVCAVLIARVAVIAWLPANELVVEPEPREDRELVCVVIAHELFVERSIAIEDFEVVIEIRRQSPEISFIGLARDRSTEVINDRFVNRI